jgi:hypothetical protein
VKAVLDEGVPDDIILPLRRLGASVDPFREEWRAFANGALLKAVEQAGYDRLLTNDKNMGFQLNLRLLRIAIVALPINRPDILLARNADTLNTMRAIKPGQVVWIGLDGSRIVRSADKAGVILSEELPRLPPYKL